MNSVCPSQVERWRRQVYDPTGSRRTKLETPVRSGFVVLRQLCRTNVCVVTTVFVSNNLAGKWEVFDASPRDNEFVLAHLDTVACILDHVNVRCRGGRART